MMALRYFLRAALPLFLAAILAAPPAAAKPGDVDRGAEVYEKRCMGCHGEEGEGDGPAAELLNPPPRDFSAGQYKIKTTTFDDMVPNDEDLLRMVRDGMPGTAMPGWGDILSEQEMWDVIAYIKTFAGLEEEAPSDQVDYGEQVASSVESIAAGEKLFHEDDRCSECHGQQGRGDAVKKLKDDDGNRTWPRNLSKFWTFRASNDAKDVFSRVSVGIPGTQMPSFADPKSKKKLSVEERWHVANYVASLVKGEEVVRPENTVVKADKMEGPLPGAPDDPIWREAAPATFFLVPQIIGKERFFTPSNDTITVRALYNADEIAFLLEWDDRTNSIPGDDKAEKIADEGMGEDAVAIQLPVVIPKGMEKPYFGMGDAANPVSLWQWKSGTAEESQGFRLYNAKGFEDVSERDAASVNLRGKGTFTDGTWRVIMRRPLGAGDPGTDIQFEEGRFIPIAFAAWDGSNGEKGSKHTMTTWYWLLLKPDAGSRPLIAAIAVALVFGAALLWWGRATAKRGGSKGA